MTAHLHGDFVPDCYRCDLSRDELPIGRTEIMWEMNGPRDLPLGADGKEDREALFEILRERTAAFARVAEKKAREAARQAVREAWGRQCGADNPETCESCRAYTLRKIRRQRRTDRAYGNGYEQGRFDERMEMHESLSTQGGNEQAARAAPLSIGRTEMTYRGQDHSYVSSSDLHGKGGAPLCRTCGLDPDSPKHGATTLLLDELDRLRAANTHSVAIVQCDDTAAASQIIAAIQAEPRLVAALRGVLELHASDGIDPEACNYCGDLYPCPTVCAVTEETS